MRQLGKQHSNRVVYGPGETHNRYAAQTCDNYRALVAKLDGLRKIQDDEFLSEADISLVSLGCIRCTAKSEVGACRLENMRREADQLIASQTEKNKV